MLTDLHAIIFAAFCLYACPIISDISSFVMSFSFVLGLVCSPVKYSVDLDLINRPLLCIGLCLLNLYMVPLGSVARIFKWHKQRLLGVIKQQAR